MVPLFTLLLSALLGTPAGPRKPQPKPAPPPVFEGTVKDSQGKPVEQALVIALCGWWRDTTPSARTDAGGRFRIMLAKPNTCTLRIEAKGLASSQRESVRPGTPLAFVLEKGGVIEGTVRDAGGGQPVAGAQVLAAAGRVLTWEPGTGQVETTTDAKGRYRLVGIGHGVYEVSASGRGYGRTRKAGVTAGGRVDLVLTSGASVTGSVLGPDQKPVADAVVRIEREERSWSEAVLPTRTDARGRFDVVGLQPGSYRLIARHSGLTPALVTGLEVEGETPVSVTLAPPIAVGGRLLDPQGRPVPGRASLQELNGAPTPSSLAEVLRADAGTDGRFRIEAVPAGSHALAVNAPRHSPKRVEFDVAPRLTTVDLGDISLEVGLAIRGRVRDRAGMGLSGARIFASTHRPMSEMGFAECESEDDGGFVLAGLREGRYELRVTAPGYAGARQEAEAGAQNVAVVLSPGGSLSGLVVDEAGRAVEAYEVDAEPSSDRLGAGGSQSVASTDGRFLVEDLVEGTYVVQVSAPDHPPAVVSGVKVAVGATTDVGRIRLSAGGILRGSVVDTGGAAIPGAAISVLGVGPEWRENDDPRALSDMAGAFEVRGVPAGMIVAVARHPQYAEGRAEGIDVDPARGPAEARIVLGQGARLEGLARRRDGAPFAGAFVQVFARREGVRNFSSAVKVAVRPDGSFTAEHLPPGRADVHLMQGGHGGRSASVQSKPVVLRDGETSSVEFVARDILISGRVTRSGVAAPRLRVSFRGQSAAMIYSAVPGVVPAATSGPQRLTAVTGEDGGYELIVDTPGSFWVMVETPDGSTSYNSRKVEVPDDDTWSLDIDFAGTAVAGLVVDRETGQPVPRTSVWAWRSEAPGVSAPGVSTTAGPDGRFEIVLEDGDYRVRASADGYADESRQVSVASGSASELRIGLARGASVKGRVVDAAGRGVANLAITASSGGDGDMVAGWGETLPDGSFEIDGLAPRPCSLFSGSALVGWAFRSGVAPGARDVTLALRPGGLASIQVLGPDGQPVEGAQVFLARVADSRVSNRTRERTDARGMGALPVPAGALEIRAGKDKLYGTARLTMPEGGTASATIKLSAEPRPRGAP